LFLFEVVHYFAAHSGAALALVFGVPILIWVFYAFWTVQSARSDVVQSIGNSSLFRWLPWVGRAAVELQKTAFARILAMLVRSSVPLDQAILLAAKSCNEQYWSRDSLEMLQRRIVEGKSNAYPKSVISPLIEWSLGIPDQRILLEGIDHYATMVRTRASLLLAKCEMFLPAMLMFILAVLIGTCYFLTVGLPHIYILNFLADPNVY
jgi:type II secretory pathway component PulF